jgi:hypothetical protein
MDLVGLYNEAVVVSAKLCVVARFWIDANGLETCGVVIGSKRVVIGCFSIGATCDFRFITDSIFVSIVHTCSVAVVSCFRIGARGIIVGCIFVVVAGFAVLATCDFKAVANAVSI